MMIVSRSGATCRRMIEQDITDMRRYPKLSHLGLGEVPRAVKKEVFEAAGASDPFLQYIAVDVDPAFVVPREHESFCLAWMQDTLREARQRNAV